MKKKRSIILISILIIVSVAIYFYKPQQNNSYQLGIIISIGNKDKSNILYYNDQLQKTGQKKLKIGNIASQYDIPKTVNDKVYMIPKGVPYVNEREEVMELDHNTQKIKLYKINFILKDLFHVYWLSFPLFGKDLLSFRTRKEC